MLENIEEISKGNREDALKYLSSLKVVQKKSKKIRIKDLPEVKGKHLVKLHANNTFYSSVLKREIKFKDIKEMIINNEDFIVYTSNREDVTFIVRNKVLNNLTGSVNYIHKILKSFNINQ